MKKIYPKQLDIEVTSHCNGYDNEVWGVEAFLLFEFHAPRLTEEHGVHDCGGDEAVSAAGTHLFCDPPEPFRHRMICLEHLTEIPGDLLRISGGRYPLEKRLDSRGILRRHAPEESDCLIGKLIGDEFLTGSNKSDHDNLLPSSETGTSRKSIFKAQQVQVLR